MVRQSYWQRCRCARHRTPAPLPYEVWWLEWWDDSGRELHGPAVRVTACATLDSAEAVRLDCGEEMTLHYGPGVAAILDRQGQRVDCDAPAVTVEAEAEDLAGAVHLFYQQAQSRRN